MDSARVQSIDALKDFKASLWRFATVAGRVLSDAESEMQRIRIWLETEQQSYWRGQIQKRAELATRARDAMLAKKLYKNMDGTPASAVEEEKAMKLAVQRLEEANHKLSHVRRYIQHLQKEMLLYQGQVQRLASALQIEIPMAASHLDELVASLEAYVAGAGAEGAAAIGEATGQTERLTEMPMASMARPEPAHPPEPADKPQATTAGKADESGDANERKEAEAQGAGPG